MVARGHVQNGVIVLDDGVRLLENLTDSLDPRTMDGMKATVDIPDALVNEIQRRAVLAGREVNDVIAELLTASISSAASQVDNGQAVAKTLPLIKAHPV